MFCFTHFSAISDSEKSNLVFVMLCWNFMNPMTHCFLLMVDILNYNGN